MARASSVGRSRLGEKIGGQPTVRLNPERQGWLAAGQPEPTGANQQVVRAFTREEGRFEVSANSVMVGAIEAGTFRELTKHGQLDPQWAKDTTKMLAVTR